jgi:hypothetical protein
MENIRRFGRAAVCVMAVLLVSCASTSAGSRSLSDLSDAEVIGSVQTTFSSEWQGMITENIRQYAYIKLKEAASNKYQGNIDIVNIIVSRVKGGGIFTGYVADFSADGQVVLLKGRSTAGLEGALARASEQIVKNVPARSKIAIVYVTAQDRSMTEYIVGELEYIWVNQGYFITDRSQLDKLREEQDFLISGEVDDKTAVSIGKFTGADIIITGRVDGGGDLRRLRLRALDIQTAQVVGAASERL